MLLLKNLLFTLLVPGSVAGVVPQLLVRGRPLAGGVLLPAGALLLAFGLVVYAWCVWDFASYGRGTPAPIDAPRRLVVRGLYRLSRNPMYVGVLAVILGQALLYASPRLALYGLGVATVFQLFVVLYEEPHLRRVFGEDYAGYCARVPRWLGARRPGAAAPGQGS